MTTANSRSPLAGVPMAPKDPILGVNELFAADKNPNKVNLGVGVYYDDNGKVPLLESVRLAERELLEIAPSRGYLPIDGLPAYDKAVQTLVFGPDCVAVAGKRVVTLQAVGGTGGLKIGADFLKQILPDAGVWISSPSWENHRALFEGAGFVVNEYPYYDPATRGVQFDAMLATLNGLAAGSVVLLHGCCHNPTGVDLAPEQWARVLDVVKTRGLVPFIDLAYQGLGDGLDADAQAARLFAASTAPVFLASSFSKSFSLYGERVGALSIVTESADEAARVLSQVKRIVRTNYSNPPTHGGQLAAAVLTTPVLREMWEKEVGAIRDRIREMRKQLVEKVQARVPGADMQYVLAQRGMFSYSGLSKAQVARLREERSVYLIDSGRMCVAAINSKNIDYVADAMAAVLQA